MEDKNSILDRVITSKKTTEIEQFNPAEVVSSLFKNLTAREEDVLRRRFGLSGKSKETLEEIGKTYNVTRERVRQIENTAVSKIKSSKNFNSTVNVIESTVLSVLEQQGSIMSENSLLTELLQVVGDNTVIRQNILFIISKLLDTRFKMIKPTDQFKQSWQTIHAPLHLLEETISSAREIIKSNGKPSPISDIIEKISKTEFYKNNQQQLNDNTIISYVEVSQFISKNPFDEYGLTEWGSIVPKRMNDKIFLVLKKHGEPMHFTEIADKINETKFDDRKAYPPTVHNELILNYQYVLVGRGIYALKEWGYKPGVVANVIAEILKKNGGAMSRDKLVKQVLDQRIVKKNTIHLALTDKTKFKKLSDGNYDLA